MTGWHLGPLSPFDLESTGVDRREARIVTGYVATILGRDAGRAVRPGAHVLINPGVPIPPEATKVHGVTDEEAQAKGWPPREGVDSLAEAVSRSLLARIPVVGFNLAYDFGLLYHECLRNDLPTVGERMGLSRDAMVGPIIDAHVLDKYVDPYRKGSRKLVDTAKHYGIVLEDAHTADADAIAAVRVAVAIAERNPEIAAMDLPQLHRAQKLWRADQMASLQRYFQEKKDQPDAWCDPCFPWCVDPTHPSG